MKCLFRRLCVFLVLICACFMLCFHTVSANEYIKPENDKYTDIFYNYYCDMYCDGEEVSDFRYKTLYEHYDIGSSDPVYVVSFMSQTGLIPDNYYAVYGNYVLHNGGWLPYWLGLYVYTPANGSIYKFDDAYFAVDDIDACFKSLMENRFAYLIGDVNSDCVLNIKDATFIQKCLAGIEDFDFDHRLIGTWEDPSQQLSHISDFNRDGRCNIKDVTTIQKHIAGLPY